VLVPLQLERAFDVEGAASGTVPTQLEPLDDLLACLIACLHASRALAVSAELVVSAATGYSRAVAALEYIAALLPRPELEDWALDASTPFATTTNVGAFNQLRGQLLLRIFEVFAGHRIVARQFPRHRPLATPTTLIMAVADSSAFLTLYGRLFAVMREASAVPLRAQQQPPPTKRRAPTRSMAAATTTATTATMQASRAANRQPIVAQSSARRWRARRFASTRWRRIGCSACRWAAPVRRRFGPT
jgi:hypothetical protein